jgi:hypothetical protein
MEDKLQLLREAFKDENFIQEMVDRLKSREEKKSKNMQRISNFFSDNKSFEGVLLRIISKHDERWADICFSRNVQPHPWEILYAVFNIVEVEGKEVDPVDALTENFPSMLLEYREHIFAWTHGQGTCLSIYNKNKELIYRD